jgi:hypothetical protein
MSDPVAQAWKRLASALVVRHEAKMYVVDHMFCDDAFRDEVRRADDQVKKALRELGYSCEDDLLEVARAVQNLGEPR